MALHRASTSEVLGYIKEIDEKIVSRDWDSCLSFFNGLSHICLNFRVTQISGLLEALRRYAAIPELLAVDRLRSELALTMYSVLRNETEYGSAKNVDEIKSSLFEAARRIASYPSPSSLSYALGFLGYTETKESVDVMVDAFVRSSATGVDVENIFGHPLLESDLAYKQGLYIRARLSSLTGSEDENVKVNAKRLLARPMSLLRTRPS